MLTSRALAALSADPHVRALLRAGTVYEILGASQVPSTAVPVIPTATFSSAADLASTLARRGLPAGRRAVVYDAEAWSYTPQAEQADPASAYARAGAAAAAHALTLIAAPALNLASAPGASSNAARVAAYLRRGLPAAAARHAAVYEIQAQSLERDAGRYAAFVTAAAAAARAANPGVTVLAGLSTNPPGTPVTAADLTAAIGATRHVVDGYWINVPGRGPRCPTCNPESPLVAVDALRRLPR